MNTQTAARQVLDFWFGAPGSPVHGRRRSEWFRKDDAFDAQVGQRFAALLDEALRGGLRDWDADPRAALARILLLDQFTRNAYRGTARAFAGDMLALAAAQALVAGGHDMALSPVERMFAYLPFEHAEDLTMQDESMRLFGTLAGGDDSMLDHAEILRFAQRHRDIIARFGRFPHRNAALGRVSTAEELSFLREPGSGF